MKKKNRKKCNFGFDLKLSCGMIKKVSIDEDPGLIKIIESGQIPPYCYQVDGKEVTLDRCLLCHIEQGYSIEYYEAINFKQIGITRQNYKEVWKILGPGIEGASRQIKKEREILMKEMIAENFPLKATTKNLWSC
jgi:hypothetical protein